ncbi:interleukin-6 receptor subunit beta-like [Scyliorhinus canicula]|uniref:interleukin-6 receptor subunit beta-like n=1 Tax=Scyliorhinus canicula TaxID=7830 RepID=UPI0018F54371|nr:interleukin-6 receptor subunit beta-like [Scyliorhinus canicula]
MLIFPGSITPLFCLIHLLSLRTGAVLEANECIRILVSTDTVQWGSPLAAICAITNTSCDVAFLTNASKIFWQLNKVDIPRTQYTILNSTVSQVNIPVFNQTVGMLSCQIHQGPGVTLRNDVRIYTGLPPDKPVNLTCVTSWKKEPSMKCSWNPGRNPHRPTNYTLRRIKNLGKCHNHEVNGERIDCLSQDSHSCTVRREKLRLFSTYDISVRAENIFGSVESDVQCIDAMDVAKLEQPMIRHVHHHRMKSHCLIIDWKLDISPPIECEFQYREHQNPTWRQKLATMNKMHREQCLCHLSPGTEYRVRLRCKLRGRKGYWSDWSLEHPGHTSESPPVGLPDVWWHIEDSAQDKKLYIQLFWKQLKDSEVNGRISGYRVTYRPEHETNHPEITLCNTSSLSCRISIPKGDGNICIRAYNSAGESPPSQLIVKTLYQTDIALHPLSVNIIPITEHSLQISWTSPSTAVNGYVVEWCEISGTFPCEMSWKKVAADITNCVLQENIEPMKRYSISVFPLLPNGVASPVSTEAYSKQGAPLIGPKVSGNYISKSQVEVIWEKIPINKCQGFIRNYTIFYNDKLGPVRYVMSDGAERKYTLTGLLAATDYMVKVMATTDAGGTNGSVVNLTTKKSDDENMLTILKWVSPLLLLLPSILLLTYFLHRRMIIRHLWLKVPNPANSTLASWSPGSLSQDWNCSEGTPDCIVSSFTFLQNDTRQNTGSAVKSSHLIEDEKGMSINGKTPNSGDTLHCLSEGYTCDVYTPYHNLSGMTQYATVLHSKDQKVRPTLFLRSESNQPLLHELNPSPRPHENPWFTMPAANDSELSQDISLTDLIGGEEIWKTFPLLWGLVSENKCD